MLIILTTTTPKIVVNLVITNCKLKNIMRRQALFNNKNKLTEHYIFLIHLSHIKLVSNGHFLYTNFIMPFFLCYFWHGRLERWIPNLFFLKKFTPDLSFIVYTQLSLLYVIHVIGKSIIVHCSIPNYRKRSHYRRNIIYLVNQTSHTIDLYFMTIITYM